VVVSSSIPGQADRMCPLEESAGRASDARYTHPMRIVVAGTHASGKSTLISDFALKHQEFTVLSDPFELVDESWDAPGAAMFATQLRVAADRLHDDGLGAHVIAERGPVDFLAYLLALAELTGSPASEELIERRRRRRLRRSGAWTCWRSSRSPRTTPSRSGPMSSPSSGSR